ncbi:MAG: hypothetical protein HY897_19245 [Deltaproteobacteria bacterium]|nr:hypothetical protein [Deltaproteobacteria bacterium]
MAGWIPEVGQRFFHDVEVVEVAECGGKRLVKYEPLFTQQRSARHELDFEGFADYFGPAAGGGAAVIAGSHWRMIVTVLVFAPDGQKVRFRYESPRGKDLGGGEMPVHIFNATFRPERAAAEAPKPELRADYMREKESSLRDVRLPHVAEVWNLRVAVREIAASEQSGIHVKYRPLDLAGLVSDKELPEKEFIANFENEDRGMTDINVGAVWAMRVRVVDVDEVEDAVWYRRETGRGEGRSLIKRMSTHVFVSSFSPPLGRA